jgi:hypothetical protein
MVRTGRRFARTRWHRPGMTEYGSSVVSLLTETFTPIEIVVTGLDPVIHLLRKTFRED